jgi:hypothetical protein
MMKDQNIYTTRTLSILGALETILLVAGDYDDDDKLLSLDAKELHTRPNYYRDEYARFLLSGENRDRTSARILYIDRSDNFCQISYL